MKIWFIQHGYNVLYVIFIICLILSVFLQNLVAFIIMLILMFVLIIVNRKYPSLIQNRVNSCETKSVTSEYDDLWFFVYIIILPQIMLVGMLFSNTLFGILITLACMLIWIFAIPITAYLEDSMSTY